MQASAPFRNKDAERLSNQVVGRVTEHGLDAVTGKIDASSLINDNNGIRTFLQEAVELRLCARPSIRVHQPIAQIANTPRIVGGFGPLRRRNVVFLSTKARLSEDP